MTTSPHPFSRRSFLRLAGSAVALGATARFSPAAAHAAPFAAPRLLRARGDRAQPNLIWVVADAVRGDHIRANGYFRATTPNIDAWLGQDGVTFAEATSVAAWTYPATAAMLTGRQPFRLHANWFNQQLAPEVITIAERLRAAGYATAGFVSAPFSQAKYGLSRGFDVYNDTVAASWKLHQNGNAAQINLLAQNWLNSWAGDKPLFLFLYYFDTHTWYNPPPPYDTLYDPTYDGDVGPEIYQNGERVVNGSLKLTPRDVEHIIALYDGELSYFDAQLGEMFGYLDSKGLLDNAALAMTSDHGEMFGEHDLWTHGNSLYEETLRVPLLMRHTALPKQGLKTAAPAQNMDVGPTFLDFAGADPAGGVDGVSLRPVMEGGMPAPRDLFSEIQGVTYPLSWAYWLAPRDSLRSVTRFVPARGASYKYILHIANPAADELYRLNEKSVYEGENIIAGEPGLAEELRAALHARYPLNRTMMPATAR